MDLGVKIKALRIQQGLTLEEVGERVGVGKSTVRKWENGQIANMRRDKIALVAHALNVTPSYLMGWTDEPHPAEKEKPAEKGGSEREAFADLFMKLNPPRQALIVGLMKDLLEAQAQEDGSLE